MMITPLSFFMAVIWSCIIILIVHCLRRRKFFLRNFGVTTVILLYAFCIARMFLTFEFSFTKVIPLPALYNKFYQTVCLDTYEVANRPVNLFAVFLMVWAAGIAVGVALFSAQYSRDWRRITRYERNGDAHLDEILQSVKLKSSRQVHTRISICPLVTIPGGIGIFKKKILLPSRSFSDRDLYYILLHEYTHICSRDLEIKMLLKIFCCIFWWNPFVYLLKSDIDQMLELRCDLRSITLLSQKETVEYLTVVKNSLAHSDGKRADRMPSISTRMIHSKNALNIIERFNFVAKWNPKSNFRFQALTLVFFTALMVASYAFILQPYYEPPKSDIITDDKARDVGTLAGYILKHKDGSYSFIDENGRLSSITAETLDVFTSMGYKIQEES